MKFGTIFERIWHRITGSKPHSPPAALPASMQSMLTGLEQTRAQELSCDEVFELLDVFAEMIQRGENAAALLPLVQHHLDMCPDCREEYEVLLASMQATNP